MEPNDKLSSPSSFGVILRGSGQLSALLRSLPSRGQVARLRHFLFSPISTAKRARGNQLTREACCRLDFLSRQLKSPTLHREAVEACRSCLVERGTSGKERRRGGRRGSEEGEDGVLWEDERSLGRRNPTEDESETSDRNTKDPSSRPVEEGNSNSAGVVIAAKDNQKHRNATTPIPLDREFTRWATVQSQAAWEAHCAATHRARLTKHRGLLRRALIEQATFVSCVQCNFTAAFSVMQEGVAEIDQSSDAAEFLREYLSLGFLSGQLSSALSTLQDIPSEWETPHDTVKRTVAMGLLHLQNLEFDETLQSLWTLDLSLLETDSPADFLFTSHDVGAYIAIALLGSGKRRETRLMLEEEEGRLTAVLSSNPLAERMVNDFLRCDFVSGMRNLHLLQEEVEKMDPLLAPFSADIFDAVVSVAFAAYTTFISPLRLLSLCEDFGLNLADGEGRIRSAINSGHLNGFKLSVDSKSPPTGIFHCPMPILSLESPRSPLPSLRQKLQLVQQNRLVGRE